MHNSEVMREENKFPQPLYSYEHPTNKTPSSSCYLSNMQIVLAFGKTDGLVVPTIQTHHVHSRDRKCDKIEVV